MLHICHTISLNKINILFEDFKALTTLLTFEVPGFFNGNDCDVYAAAKVSPLPVSDNTGRTLEKKRRLSVRGAVTEIFSL